VQSEQRLLLKAQTHQQIVLLANQAFSHHQVHLFVQFVSLARSLLPLILRLVHSAREIPIYLRLVHQACLNAFLVQLALQHQLLVQLT
jgi:hypothetical protein